MTKPLALITGGGGFIGSHLAAALLEKGYRVRLLDNMYRADRLKLASLLENSDVDFVEGDVRFPIAVNRAMQGVSYVAHLASVAINKSVVDPDESIDINLVGSQNVFSAAVKEGVKRVVFTSTASVYGEPPSLPMAEDGPLNPHTPYCLSKLAAEHLLAFYAKHHGLSGNTLRLFNVYGPGQRTDAYYTSVIQVFIKRILAGEAPIIQGAGDQSMDFVHVSDVVTALVAALETDSSGQVINIGTGVSTSIAQLARTLIDALNVDVEPQFEARDVLVTRRAADISRARKVLHWSPRVPASEGLAQLARVLADEVSGVSAQR